MSNEQITKVLAEEVLRWEPAARNQVFWFTKPDHKRTDPFGCYVRAFSDFNPTTDLNHTKMVWDALTEEQKSSAHDRLTIQVVRQDRVPGDLFLDAAELSKAIYAVVKGDK